MTEFDVGVTGAEVPRQADRFIVARVKRLAVFIASNTTNEQKAHIVLFVPGGEPKRAMGLMSRRLDSANTPNLFQNTVSPSAWPSGAIGSLCKNCFS